MKLSFGQKLKDARLAKNLTQPELAKLLQVSNGLISFWENDINEPKASYIAKICKILDIEPAYLLGLEDEDGHKEPADYEFKYEDSFQKFVHREKK